MRDLQVRNWEDWEEICCYYMSYIVCKNTNCNIDYRSYGSRGQSQFGIDLVPKITNIDIVGQCKLKDTGSFTWNDVLAELKKTDKYRNNIKYYFLFTTANPHTTIHDNNGYIHKRSNGDEFKVHVIYWSEVRDISFIPQNVIQRIFPSAFNIFKDQEKSNEDFLKALKAFKEYIPKKITQDNLRWLEKWDFSTPYIYEDDYYPFQDLYYEFDRARHGKNGIRDFLYVRDRDLLAEGLPASDEFFDALEGFINVFKNSIIGDTHEDGNHILTLKGFRKNEISKITYDWKNAALHLAFTYRKLVLGEHRD